MNRITEVDNLYRIVGEAFKVKAQELNDDLGPDDIEAWDSLGQLRLIAAIESHYKITLEISEIFEIFTIKDIRCLLIKKGKISSDEKHKKT